MTPSTSTPLRDEDFEAEVRAMLARRADDVSRTSAAPRPDDDGLGAAAERVSRARFKHRVLAAAAATVVLVAGSTAYIAGREDRAPSAVTDATPAGAPPIIWPLDDHVGPDALASPESAAAAYLTEMLDSFDPAMLRPPTSSGGDTAWVSYGPPRVAGDSVSEVEVRRDGDRWGVTRATSSAVNPDRAYPDGGDVVVTFTIGPAAVDGLRLRAQAIDPQGDPAQQAVASLRFADEDGVQVEVPPSSGDDREASAPEGEQIIVVPPPIPGFDPIFEIVIPDGDTERPVAVRLDALAPDDGDPSTPDALLGHAAVHVSRPGDGTGPPIPGTDTGADASDDGAPPDGGSPEAGAPTTIDPLVEAEDWALYARRGHPVEVAQAYLDDRLPESERADGLGLVPEEASIEVDHNTGTAVAVVPWTITPDTCRQPCDTAAIAERYRGAIRMQSIDGGWAVVAATTDAITVTDVSREGATLEVTVERVNDAAIDTMDIGVYDLDGHRIGETTYANLGLPGTYRVELGDEAPEDTALTLRVQHVGGAVFSLTEVRVAILPR